MRHFTIHATIALLVIIGCSEHFPSQPSLLQPPETYVSLMPDGTLRRSSSQQHIHWWGVAPSGLIKGYFFSFDSLHWVFTTQNDSTFGLKLSTTDTTYRFFVSAVDDRNVVDPTPATMRYPISNSPPTVAFVFKSDVPETTYTVATFQWNGSDLDGNETIVNYYYALDDTTNPAHWISLPGTANRVTLFKQDGLTQGFHSFYLKARDIAGAYSKVIRMPDPTGIVPKKWYVREPQGDFLIVRDYFASDQTGSFYTTLFDTLMGGRLGSKDVLDIKKGSSSTQRGVFVPALINPTFTETLKLFKYVYWYSDNAPSLDIAQASIPTFIKAGGKVLFSAEFPENTGGQGNLVDFAPLDNVEPTFFASRLYAGDSLVALSDQAYPLLTRNSTGYVFARGVLPKVSARLLYRMQQDSTRLTGYHIMGVKDADQPSMILMGVMLHQYGPAANLATFFRHVYKDEFKVP